MRILSISGQNIASLADPFHIDLTAEPLRSAGLFAITGETGTGKSSILDAMCLALYGDAPRLSSGSAQDEIPDAGGEAIKARDPRAMLRRGAATGWASVTFLGNDGLVYEARWTARRSRDRVDGALQKVSRQIARVSDGQVMAGQLSAVGEKVQALTGLSYDEFRRTVLLAQGDFDAFLRAETNERAALLEKVTGTGLYRAISARVFERTAEAQTALTGLTMQRDAHRLLSDAECAVLEADLAALTAAVETARPERLALEADLAAHKRLAEAQVRLAEADAALTDALTARDAAEPGRLHLATLDRAEPLRLPFEAVLQAQATRDRAAGAAAQAETQHRHAQTQALALRRAADAATASLGSTEAAFKELGPVWTMATQLDSRLLDAASEVARAAATATATGLVQDRSLADLAAVQGQSRDIAHRLDTARRHLEGLAPYAPLAEGWTRIDRDLTDRDTEHHAQMDARNRALALQNRATDLRQQAQAFDSADAVDREARLGLAEKILARTTSLAEREAGDPQAALPRLTGLAETLGRLERSRADLVAALTAAGTADRTQTRAMADHAAAERSHARGQTALHQAEARAAALSAPAAEAGLAVSDQARALRLHLQPGAPCPVCGAVDHAAPSDAALVRLAALLRADLAAAQADAKSARDQMTQSLGQMATAAAQAAQARQTGQTERGRAATAAAIWDAGLLVARASRFCAALPDQPEAAGTALATAIGAADSAKARTLAALAELATLRRDKDAAEARRSQLTAALEARQSARHDLTTQAAETAQATALAQQSAAAAVQRIADLDATLAPLLQAAAEPVTDLDAAPAALRDRLKTKAEACSAALAAATELQAALADLTPRCVAASTQATEAAAQADAALRALVDRSRTRDALFAGRAALLDGEATEAHRTRHNQARLDVQSAKDGAARALGLAEAALGLAAGHHASAVQSLGDGQTRAAAAELTLTTALGAQDLSLDTLRGLFAEPRAGVAALRLTLRALQDAATGALSARDARHADLTRALSQGLPTASAEALDLSLVAHDQAQATRQERIGQRHARLAQDRATRATLQGLQAEIDRATATLQVWQAVNTAIGSRNGDAFARIAQSITLDLLVDHANHHLADLKPRYRLRRAAGLALQVEDLDMGAEARATRSLSGGERFLVSLALALALSRMGDTGGLAATLFIDEGFGALDATSLDLAIDALETLQAQGRMIGVISHVEAMKDRIPVQIQVSRLGGGKSRVTVQGPRTGLV